MKRAGVLAILVGAVAAGAAPGGAIIIDHNSVDVSIIPDESVAAAAALRLLLRHASVGQGIGWGFDCLAGLKPTNSSCACFAPGKYDRSNWVLEARMGDGKSKIDDLVTQAETRTDQFDVFMMKYCYIDALGDSHPDWEYYRSRMEDLEATYPGKRFVWWTIPLTRDGQPGTDVFNALVRAYCAANGKILFDIADIECHDPSGVKLTNAQGHEVISQRYTNEVHAGHFNVEGRIRAASALWRLMAAIADDLRQPPAPRIICVDDDATGANDGTSWPNAYPFLQDALADANDSQKPVEIRVAQGVYKPDRSSAHPDGTGDRFATFCLLDDVAVIGGFAGIGAGNPDDRDVNLRETILSGDLAGDDVVVLDACDLLTEPTRAENSYALVTGGPCSRSAVLDGFIIRSGNAIGPERHELDQKGAGLLLSYYGADSCASIRNCTLFGNSARYGGAAYVIGAAPEFINCTFGNNAAMEGGAIRTSVWRGPWYTSACDFVIKGCLFAGNYAHSAGGAIYNSASVSIANCLLIHNVADETGGAIYSGGYELDITSCTLADNTAPTGLALTCFSPATTITNTIFRNGGDERHAEIFIGAITGMNITYSNVQGGWPPGAGNIDVDPLFAHPVNWDPNAPTDPNDSWIAGDYHLKSQAGRWDPRTRSWVLDDVTSPCIDAGDPNSPVGDEAQPNGGRLNLGAYGGTPEASKSPTGK